MYNNFDTEHCTEVVCLPIIGKTKFCSKHGGMQGYIEGFLEAEAISLKRNGGTASPMSAEKIANLGPIDFSSQSPEKGISNWQNHLQRKRRCSVNP